MEDDRYRFGCQRFIELDPVRAGLVGDPSEYPWSSRSANTLGVLDGILRPHPLYAGLAATAEARQAAFRGLCSEALVDEQLTEIRAATKGGIALGSERFQREVAAMLGRRTWRGRLGGRRTQKPEAGQIEVPI